MNKLQILKSAKEVLTIESKAINDLAKSLNDDFFKSVKSIENLKGKLIISGVGKSGNIASKIAASFTSTGIPSVFLNPVDASHGDMGIVRAEDILIVLSNSGESHELSDLLDFAKRHSVKIISICSNNKSLLAKNSDINLILPPHKEADKLSTIPTTSTTMTLALGDALCCCLLNLRNFDKKSFKALHPGGKIGKKLKTLSEIMDTDLPLIKQNTSVMEAVLKMTEKKYGCVVIIDNQKKIKGIITDGDLRRAIKKLDMSDKATNIMSKKPITATKDLLISSAIALMNKNSITSLLITKKNTPIGIVNLKTCLENE
jgi:arabinose-5-phosphate isomerase